MDSQIISENLVLLYFIGMGAFIALIYDILRIFRKVVKHSHFMVSIEDLLFWCFCAIIVFILLQRENNGILRWFAILGAIIGMFIYHKLLGQYFVKYSSKILLCIKEQFEKPLNIIKKKCTSIKKYVIYKINERRRRNQNQVKDLYKILKMMIHKK